MELSTTRSAADRLVLGGHSYIRQLGSDPRPDDAEQARLVEACLDAGLTWFDTTYQPERVALGKALKALGRRAEAHIIAWNFFQPFGDADNTTGGPDFHTADRLPRMLDELQTDYIDALVVHPMGDAARDVAQEELAASWKAQGIVGELGMWKLWQAALDRHGGRGPYDFIVHPRNITTGPDADAALARAKQAGLMTLACSPFVRGWELDKLVAAALAQQPVSEREMRRKLSECLLRYALHWPTVDRLIVSMRRAAWVQSNIQSVKRGPLSADELRWLGELRRG